jgi:hypothetical protein
MNAKLFVKKKAGAQISSWDMDLTTEHANLCMQDAILIIDKNLTTMQCQLIKTKENITIIIVLKLLVPVKATNSVIKESNKRSLCF